MKTQNQNPKIEVVKYKGVDYKIRTIEVRDRLNGVVLTSKIRIAPIELNEAYNEKRINIHGSKEQVLDASIDHYVTKEVIKSLPNVITSNDIMETMIAVMSCEVESEW